MACTKCKKKQQEDYVRKELQKTDKTVVILLIGVAILSLYGIYSLIRQFV
jgi:hypothetical protein